MSYSRLAVVGYAAVGTSMGTLVMLTGLSMWVLWLLRRVVWCNMKQMAESLPKVISLIEASQLDISVLIAVCEEKGTTAEELAAMFKEDQDRKVVVERRFGSKSRLTKRYLAWNGAVFMHKGYPAEQYLVEFLNKASTNPDAPAKDADKDAEKDADKEEDKDGGEE